MSWKKDLALSVRSKEALIENSGINPGEEEEAFFSDSRKKNFAFSVPRYYLSLIGQDPDDPVRIQCIPKALEFEVKPWELDDPLGEDKYKVTDRLIHRYRDRVLFLVTDTCAMYCRHCFRRSFTGQRSGVVSQRELKQAAEYIRSHREVAEVILSGGDPLTLETEVLDRVLSELKEAREDIVFRIGTRVPVVLPSRIDKELVKTLRKYLPLFVITQFNHAKEITLQSTAGCGALIDSGIPVLNQAVLLKGVNDSVPELEDLFHALVRNRIKPYYLFQGDLAAGTSHLRVSLKKGLSLMKELRTRISGLSLPVYAVDLPGGGGKIPLTESYTGPLTEKGWELYDARGNVFLYPEE